MIAFEQLALLALGELSEADARAVEDHVLGCEECARRLERLLDLGEGIRDVARSGGAALLAGRALVERLDREGRVTRRYRLTPGGEVACTVDAGDVYTAIHLAVEARGERRLDLLVDSPYRSQRMEDVPFDPAGGEVVFVQPAEYLRTLPTARTTLRLVAPEQGGDRVIGEYTLHHTAFSPEARE